MGSAERARLGDGLEEVVHSLGPPVRSQDPKGNFVTVLSVCGRDDDDDVYCVGIHTICNGVEANGSVWGRVDSQIRQDTRGQLGAARPFISLHQYARYVPTFPDDARLG
jgi:hypothetical protein